MLLCVVGALFRCARTLPRMITGLHLHASTCSCMSKDRSGCSPRTVKPWRESLGILCHAFIRKQCVKQSFRVSYQPLNLGGVEGGSAQRPPEALRRSRNFFFSYLVAISFPIEFDVWGRLCTHFEAAKVMTFAPVTQHFTVSPFVKKQN